MGSTQFDVFQQKGRTGKTGGTDKTQQRTGGDLVGKVTAVVDTRTRNHGRQRSRQQQHKSFEHMHPDVADFGPAIANSFFMVEQRIEITLHRRVLRRRLGVVPVKTDAGGFSGLGLGDDGGIVVQERFVAAATTTQDMGQAFQQPIGARQQHTKTKQTTERHGRMPTGVTLKQIGVVGATQLQLCQRTHIRRHVVVESLQDVVAFRQRFRSHLMVVIFENDGDQ